VIHGSSLPSSAGIHIVCLAEHSDQPDSSLAQSATQYPGPQCLIHRIVHSCYRAGTVLLGPRAYALLLNFLFCGLDHLRQSTVSKVHRRSSASCSFQGQQGSYHCMGRFRMVWMCHSVCIAYVRRCCRIMFIREFQPHDSFPYLAMPRTPQYWHPLSMLPSNLNCDFFKNSVSGQYMQS
jgi:hypothetical protein